MVPEAEASLEFFHAGEQAVRSADARMSPGRVPEFLFTLPLRFKFRPSLVRPDHRARRIRPASKPALNCRSMMGQMWFANHSRWPGTIAILSDSEGVGAFGRVG